MRLVLLPVCLFATSLAFTSLTGCSGTKAKAPDPSPSVSKTPDLSPSVSRTPDPLVEAQLSLKVSNLQVDTGDTFYKRGRYDEAIVEYTKAIETYPTNAKAYAQRGIAYQKRDKYTDDLDKAKADFEKALELSRK